MQGLLRAVRSCQEMVKLAVLQHSPGREAAEIKRLNLRAGSVTSSPSMQHRGLENTTVEDVLMIKGEENVGSWLWCHTYDSVHDAVKQMAQNNVGSLVVLKPGDKQLIAGIITERDYLKKIAAEGRPAKYTRVGDIMTEENKLITVTSDMKILQAMQIMTENHIRHVPVVDGKIIGMISIVDVVRAVVEQQSGDVRRLSEFIRGDYY
ncbi:hypothetical protein Nepgr_006005 [Nepenthes gracilis]|uniref:CBS domain-containing protein n=1 Tax=Nepenthes gracilis TaxID=150966 RepID=A0AAD3S4F9_NEPGR|nr:hypothetical protein Nepgr_006005 [Nepenthes gracilis]